MKTRLLPIALLVFVVSNIWAQEKSLRTVEPTVGIGRLQVSLNDAIPLYQSANDTHAFDTLTFSKATDGTDRGKLTMATKSKLTIDPFMFQPGSSNNEAAEAIEIHHYPVLVLRVTSLVKGDFEVVLNERTFETCIIKKDKAHTLYTNGTPYWSQNHSSETSAPAWFLYESWTNYLKRLFAVSVVNPKMYDNPNGSLVLSSDGEILFQPVYVIEQWLKVRLTGEQKDGVRDEVWVRWTDGRNLLLTPTEEAYY
jgi:hypothetical protein